MAYSPSHRNGKRVQALCTLGELLPQLRELRDPLYTRIAVFGDLPESYGRLLLNLPAEQPAWSRTDALLKG
jgi:hypothetical protein